MTALFYSEPVFRPPSEGNSLLLTVSIGCTFNCTFCYPYKHKKFSIRNIEDIKRDIDNGSGDKRFGWILI